jgi:hypothetical protein
MSDREVIRRLVRQFWCPTCRAQPGEHCRTRSGREAVIEHDPRHEALTDWVDAFVNREVR